MLKKITAIILSLLLIMQILPMSVFAQEIDEVSEEIIEEETEIETEQARIIAEDDTKRDENTKHYLLSDGSYNAVVYPVPVHYQKDGEKEWTEIDNTLVETKDENENVYYIPSESPIDVKFAKHGDSNNLVNYTIDGYEISWSYEDGDFGLLRNYSKMSPKSKNKTQSIKDENIPADVLENIEASAEYNHFYDNVDIEYTVTSEGVKENIILNKQSAQNVFFIRYNIGELTAKQTNERLITLYDGENAVLQISAPYMIDNNSVSSDAISFEIVEQENGVLRVCLTADSQWLNADDREYPVTVDPYIFEVNEDISNDATYISKNISSDNYPHGSLVVGKCSDYGVSRSYLKFDLPTLSAGDMVIGGTLGLYQFSGTSGYSTATGASSIRVNVARVTADWTAKGVIYSSTTPAYNSTVIDSIEVSSVSKMTLRTFDIGKLVKGWYNNQYTNYGIRLYSANESDTTYAIFASTDYDKGSHPPILVVSYLNNKGLEDRWTYHSQSLGESGTSYINDCTGNLVVVSPVCNTVGNNAPASVTLVYNSYLVGSSGTNIGKCGPGWRFDFQQQITAIDSNGSELHQALSTAGFSFIYTDADGTDHYFKLKTDSTTEYEDEEGYGMILTVGSDGDAKYTLEFKSGAKNIYNTNGNIVKICDADNNYCKYTYNSSNQLSYITDGYGRKLTFTYTAAGYFNKITDDAGRVTTISYHSPAKIKQITYPDGATTKFEYDSNNRLIKCTAIDGTAITYEYPVSDYATIKNRVIKVEELATDGTAGNSLSMSYDYNNYTNFTDNEGRTEKYVFDNYGRTVCILDANGNGSKYSYTSSTTSGTANKLTSTSSKTRYVDNLLKNHSFENGTTDWIIYGAESTAAEIKTDAPRLGKNALRFSKSTDGAAVTAYQKIYLSSGLIKEKTTYTFSAYVKTNSASTKAYMYINCYDTDTSTSLASVSSAKVTEKTDEYKRISIYVTVPEGTDYVNFALSASGTGAVWFDCLQVEAGSIANDYNLLENSGFEDESSSAWVGVNLGTNDGRKEDSNGNGYFRIYGDIATNKGVYQKVVINKLASDCAFSVSGYANANSLPIISNRYFSINIKLVYSDDTTEYQNISFEPSVTTTQYTTGIIKPYKDYQSKTLSYVLIRPIYYRNLNYVNFNNLSVNIDETGTSYTYDSNGNVVSAADNANANRTFTYDDASNLLTSTYEDNTSYTYEYYDVTDNMKNEHRLKSATSANSGIKMTYGYNTKGGVSSVTVSKDGYAKSITTSTAYDTTGNYVLSQTDALGNTTSYSYDTTKGTLSTVTDAKGNKTNYAYNANNDNITSVSSGSSTVNYTYNSKRMLSSIASDTSTYSFTYNKFNNLESVKLFGTELIKNAYEDNNGNLVSSTYGNGDNVNYTYDSRDRVIATEYKNSSSVRQSYYGFAYDWQNRLARVANYTEGYTTYYTYDLSDRLIEKNRSDGAYIKTAYNEKNQTTGVTYSFNGLTESALFKYDLSNDNALYETVFTDGSNSNIYYDELGRVSSDYVISNKSRIVTASYTYLDQTAAKTSGLVSKIDYLNSNLADINYTYDSIGNITKITHGDGTYEEYTYDELNRLQKIEYSNGDWEMYTYDNSGNITAKGIVADGNSTVISYTYGNSYRPDLLTKYNGTTITYDDIYNPLTYGSNTFTWNGRRMTSYSDGTTTTTYKYNEDGVRTSKTVGSTKTEFLVDGTTILAQKTGSTTIPYYYDGNGKRIAFKYGGNMYFYVYNLQGDVTHILDASKNIVGTYEYDAWGKITNLSSLTSIAQINPFRYRGYYYDTESGLYYLNSRYYNPEWGRFINTDSGIYSVGGSVNGYNLFVYCDNNPINNIDPYGNCPYNGTAADFHRLQQGLPSLDCTCVDLTDKLNSFMINNATELKQYKKDNGTVKAMVYFYKNVTDGGSLDIKLQDEWKFENGRKYLFNGIELRYDDPGNINFGYVGAVIFPEILLCAGAGLNQIGKYGFKFGDISTFFDDPRDNEMIKYGFSLYGG